METRAYIKNVKISPKKIRFLLPEIKKLRPSKALEVLFYSPEKSAKILYKAIKSALTNAKAAGVDETGLGFKVLTVEGARKLKRFRAGGRGMAKSIMKRYSHIKVVLSTVEPKLVKTTGLQVGAKINSPEIRNSKSEIRNKSKSPRNKTIKTKKNSV